MWMLVSLSKVKAALRVDHDTDDALLSLYTAAASRAVHEYLGDQAGEVLSIDSPPNSPPDDLEDVDERIQMAVIMLAGHFYRSPDTNEDNAFEQGYLPKPVTAILYPLRDPTLA